MRAILLIGTLVLMAACAEQPTYQDPPPGYAQPRPAPEADPCDRSDYPSGPAGDAEYTNCVIQS